MHPKRVTTSRKPFLPPPASFHPQPCWTIGGTYLRSSVGFETRTLLVFSASWTTAAGAW